LKSNAESATEFDAIASALKATSAVDHLTAAQRAVLNAIPPAARCGLDVGCGDGLLARAVAAHGVSMLAIDLAPQMIALAQGRTEARLDIVYQVGDIMTAVLAPQSFDVVFSVNTVHHMPLADILPRLAALVAPGPWQCGAGCVGSRGTPVARARGPLARGSAGGSWTECRSVASS